MTCSNLDFGGQKDAFGKNWRLAYNGLKHPITSKTLGAAAALGPQWNDVVVGYSLTNRLAPRNSFFWLGEFTPCFQMQVGHNKRTIKMRVPNCLGFTVCLNDLRMPMSQKPRTSSLSSVHKLNIHLSNWSQVFCWFSLLFAGFWTEVTTSTNFSFSIVFATFWCSKCSCCMVFCN